MSFGASAHFTALQVEHVTDSIPYSRDGNGFHTWLPTSKPATPHIDFNSVPLSEFSKFCRVRVLVVRYAPFVACGNVFCELVVDGVSQGVQEKPIDTLFNFYYGDYDPLVSHHVQIFLWIGSGSFEVQWFSGTVEVGTVSLTAKTVWLKPLVKSTAMLFSDSGIYDTTHLFTDDTQVTDYDLWWSGGSVVFKGTNFSVSGDLIFQIMSVE